MLDLVVVGGGWCVSVPTRLAASSFSLLSLDRRCAAICWEMQFHPAYIEFNAVLPWFLLCWMAVSVNPLVLFLCLETLEGWR